MGVQEEAGHGSGSSHRRLPSQGTLVQGRDEVIRGHGQLPQGLPGTLLAQAPGPTLPTVCSLLGLIVSPKGMALLG